MASWNCLRANQPTSNTEPALINTNSAIGSVEKLLLAYTSPPKPATDSTAESASTTAFEPGCGLSTSACNSDTKCGSGVPRISSSTVSGRPAIRSACVS